MAPRQPPAGDLSEQHADQETPDHQEGPHGGSVFLREEPPLAVEQDGRRHEPGDEQQPHRAAGQVERRRTRLGVAVRPAPDREVMPEDDEEQVVEILGQVNLRPEHEPPPERPEDEQRHDARTLPPGHPNAWSRRQSAWGAGAAAVSSGMNGPRTLEASLDRSIALADSRG